MLGLVSSGFVLVRGLFGLVEVKVDGYVLGMLDAAAVEMVAAAAAARTTLMLNFILKMVSRQSCSSLGLRYVCRSGRGIRSEGYTAAFIYTSGERFYYTRRKTPSMNI